jgi:hypothetical protein
MAALTTTERSRFFAQLPHAVVPDPYALAEPEPPSLLFVLACGIVRLALDRFGQMGGDFNWPGEAEPSEDAKGLACFESILFTLQCIGRFGFSKETVHKRDAFMDDLTFTVHAILWQMAASDLEQQRFCLFFIGEYNSRADESSRYKWESPDEESRWNTVPYEYGKRLMNILWRKVDPYRLAGLAAIELDSAAGLVPSVKAVIEKYEPGSGAYPLKLT